eukprot:SAG31_NODE_1615_length_7737_cov_5.540848_5_plen_98_part_00
MVLLAPVTEVDRAVQRRCLFGGRPAALRGLLGAGAIATTAAVGNGGDISIASHVHVYQLPTRLWFPQWATAKVVRYVVVGAGRCRCERACLVAAAPC